MEMMNTTIVSNSYYAIKIKPILSITTPKLFKPSTQNKTLKNTHQKTFIPCKSSSSENKTQQLINEDTSTQQKEELKKDTNNNIPQSDIWELDFCSRPMVDGRNKKVWELLICDPQRNFQHSEYFANNRINSTEVIQLILLFLKNNIIQ